MEWEREKFKKMFPNLSHEIEGRLIPTVMDHLEICKNEKEAIEVIEFFEGQGEITKEYAAFLKNNIKQLSFLFGRRVRGDYTRRGLL
jgi:hypothetical protein